jgi:eukaryotic-like serine/threonine-protein kinase
MRFREAFMESAKEYTFKDDLALDDLEFLMKTQLLRATPDEAKKQLLSAMVRHSFRAGERFIHQSDAGDRFYLIQSGSCLVNILANGQWHPVARLKPGEIVGEMSVLTGENRSAHVDAETDMVAWALTREGFEEIGSEYPQLREFLTELATERLCSRKITAERSIGKYTINEVLAEGGWSIVYKGLHSFLNLPVAIKMLKHTMAIDAELFNKFQEEARIIAGLNHENIVRVYDIEHVFRTVFIIMEHLNGVTLRQILGKRFRLPVPRILRILQQVGAGLDYAHRQGIVHQDVKPGNIFVQNDDLVKIVDFGLACPIGGCSDDLPGTAFYMAPEQIEGEPVDPRTDVYSLGIVAFEMATGRRPFPGQCM